MVMKCKKTPNSKRMEYIYKYVGTDGKNRTEHIVLGENGVTKKHIAQLHALDDKEIYNNLKNCGISLTEEENATSFDKVGIYSEEFFFADFTFSYRENSNNKGVQTDITYLDDIPQDVERLLELVELLSEFDRKIYELVFIKGFTYKEAASILGVKKGMVGYHANKIIDFIKINF